MRFFDPRDDVSITQRRLPHWSQDGALCFITWRTHDSIPRAIAAAWQAERNRWLAQHGIDPTASGWKRRLHEQEAEIITEFHDRFTTRWHEELDACHGACVLRQPELAAMVADSLLHFHGDRYEMLDFVIMPNHVHFIASFPDRLSVLSQCDSWKHYTTCAINRQIGRRGRFWQKDAFDHLVRNEGHLFLIRQYIADNPIKAGLRLGEFLYRDVSKVAASLREGKEAGAG